MTNTKILSDESNVTSTLLNGTDMHHFIICLLILTISSDDSIYNTAFSPFISSYQYELLFLFISKTNRICKTFAYFCIKQTEEYHVYVFLLIPNNLYEVRNKMHFVTFCNDSVRNQNPKKQNRSKANMDLLEVGSCAMEE